MSTTVKLGFEDRQQAARLHDEMVAADDLEEYAYELVFLRGMVNRFRALLEEGEVVLVGLGDKYMERLREALEEFEP
jgi:hypothetical protein